ncbi:uncharacterized abhydrolase domain-containing protein DDB_G0269086 [Selaginella moellendorffii]|uniref:uncharacterized abhydrolase domain-containing protein DDB_G0269086 n=1 Tax=Selaginella moellendorffii TaxID=88036 RepID=UPI000D1C441C|nr:uncharacterized abhydrolase domain-containing protein DDB_G0269086 [Selaginella moellendorffii]|eukprot:XP_024528427.1 uncharacterized abhydrolase domain-containing protein DDB_G0269086 [Selaginella moellendorffii]
MEADAPLDCAHFLLTPTRTRCELVVSSGDQTEKLASGLLQPFSSHIKAVNEEIDKGGCSIKLEPSGDDAASWFTKGTMERFVRFVSTPEVLERVDSVDNELSQLEETLSRHNDGSVSGPETPVSVNGEASQGHLENLQNSSAGEQENPNLQLLKALEARRAILQKEKSMAFARAEAAGFSAKNTSDLMRFAQQFGASRLSDACESYMRFCMKKRETEIWLEGMQSHSRGDVEDGPNFDLIEDFINDSKECDSKEAAAESERGVQVILDHEEASGRRTSVQEKITMFESKKQEIEDRRRVADIGRTDTQKPVLRRWSLAADKLGRKPSELVEKGKDLNQSSMGGKIKQELEGPVDSSVVEDLATGAIEDVSTTGNAGPLLQEPEPSDDQKSVLSETPSLKDTKGRLYDTYRERRDAKLKEEGTSKKAEKQARLKVMQESLDRRRAEVAKTLRSSKNDPLAEARLRAEKIRAFKAGLLELKRAKEEEERKRLEELRLQRLQKKVAPSSPHSGASTPRLPAKATSSKGLLPTFQRASTTQSSNSQGSRGRKPAPALDNPRKVQQEKPEAIATKANLKDDARSQNARLRSIVLRRSMPSSEALRRSSSMGAGHRREIGRLSGEAASSGLKFLDAAATDLEDDEVSSPMINVNSKAERVEEKEEDGDEAAAAAAMEAETLVIRAPVTADDDLLPARVIDAGTSSPEKNVEPGPPGVAAVARDGGDYIAPIAPVSISPMVLVQTYNV